MPKRPAGSCGMYNSRIMAATLYLPMASPYYFVFNIRFFTLVQNNGSGASAPEPC